MQSPKCQTQAVYPCPSKHNTQIMLSGTGGTAFTEQAASPGSISGKATGSTTVLFLNSLFLSCALLLTACGDPEKSAQSAIDEAQKAWQGEASDLDPLKRLESYNEIIKSVEDVGKDYAETSYGKAIAAGRSVDGVSLSAMKQARDELAPRAECYANPTVDCLRPFSSHPGGDSGSVANSSNDAFAQAQQLVCDKGFSAADHALDNFRINKPAYSQELVQVALAAAACGKPAEVKEAIHAYMSAMPEQGDSRIQSLLSILATQDLEPAWPLAIKELEDDILAPDFPKSTAASITATLVGTYAQTGDTKTALEKYHYLTDTLGYEASTDVKKELTRELIIHGDAAEGLKLVADPKRVVFTVIALHDAAATVGNRLKLVDANTSLPMHYNLKEISDYMAPVDAQMKSQYDTAATAIETELDRIAPTITIRDNGIGLGGADLIYGTLALVRQKLGEPDKATADLKKGEALRATLLAQSDNTIGLEYFAEYQTMLAIAQGDLDKASHDVKAISLNMDYAKVIITMMARQGEAEKALTFVGELGRQADPNDYDYIVDGLIHAGKLDQAEQVINAFPGDAASRSGYYWKFVQKMANEGDASGAEDFAKQHGLTAAPRDRLRLLYTLMDSKKIAGDRKQAEPILREMFSIAQEMDKAGSGSSSYGQADNYRAEQVATQAFSNGYTDLGIELYEAAANKDQRPLLHAFSDNMKPRDMTPVLMLAQVNLSGQPLQYVIDAGIRHLQKL
jgi:hypothetical protein